MQQVGVTRALAVSAVVLSATLRSSAPEPSLATRDSWLDPWSFSTSHRDYAGHLNPADLELAYRKEAPFLDRVNALIRVLDSKSPSGYELVPNFACELNDDRELQSKLIFSGTTAVSRESYEVQYKLGRELLVRLGGDPDVKICIGGMICFPSVETAPEFSRMARSSRFQSHNRLLLLNHLSTSEEYSAEVTTNARAACQSLSETDLPPWHVDSLFYEIGRWGDQKSFLTLCQRITRGEVSLPKGEHSIWSFESCAQKLVDRGALSRQEGFDATIAIATSDKVSASQGRFICSELIADFPDEYLVYVAKNLSHFGTLHHEQLIAIRTAAELKIAIPNPILEAVSLCAVEVDGFPAARAEAILVLGMVCRDNDFSRIKGQPNLPIEVQSALDHAELLAGATEPIARVLSRLEDQEPELASKEIERLGELGVKELFPLLEKHLLTDWSKDDRTQAGIEALRVLASEPARNLLVAFSEQFIDQRAQKLDQKLGIQAHHFRQAVTALCVLGDYRGVNFAAISEEGWRSFAEVLMKEHRKGDALATYLLAQQSPYSLVIPDRPNDEVNFHTPDVSTLITALRKRVESAPPAMATPLEHYASLLEQAREIGIMEPYRLYPKDLEKVIATRQGKFDPSAKQLFYLAGFYDHSGLAQQQHIPTIIEKFHKEGWDVWYYEIAAIKAGQSPLQATRTIAGAVSDVKQFWAAYPTLRFDVVDFKAHARGSHMYFSDPIPGISIPAELRQLNAKNAYLLRECGFFELINADTTFVILDGCNTATAPPKDEAEMSVFQGVRNIAGDDIGPKRLIGTQAFVADTRLVFDAQHNFRGVGYMYTDQTTKELEHTPILRK